MSSRPASVVGAVTGTLGGGDRRVGAVVLGVLVVAAVLLPVVLVLAFTPDDGTNGSPVLGLVLGILVDLLAVVLLLVVVSHKVTARRLRALGRAVQQLDTNNPRLEAAIARQDKVLKSQTTEAAKARSAVETAVGRLDRRVLELGNRVQATQNLFAVVPPRGPVPQMVGYVASPDVLLLLVQQLRNLRPSLAIECGSGTSTLFLALAVQQYGLDTRLVSLENDAEYAGYTRQLLAEHGVAHLADVRHAPLTPTSLPDHASPWYDPAAFQDLHDIGLVFVDGPPAPVGPQARYPLVPLLGDRLASTCVIVLDDMNRRDEQDVAERWTTQLDGFSYRFLPLTRGAGVFSRGT